MGHCYNLYAIQGMEGMLPFEKKKHFSALDGNSNNIDSINRKFVFFYFTFFKLIKIHENLSKIDLYRLKMPILI